MNCRGVGRPVVRWVGLAVGVVLLVGAPPAVAGATAAVTTAAGAIAPTVRLSTSDGPPGTTVTASGTHFTAADVVTIMVDTTRVASVQADASGAFTAAPFKVPTATPPGKRTVSAVAGDGARTARAVFTVQTDWPQYRGGPERQGYDATENVIDTTTVNALHPSWTVPIPIGPGDVIAARGLIYTASPTTQYALDAATGAVRWATPIGLIRRPGVITGGRLIVYNDGKSQLVALDASSGAVLWVSPLKVRLSHPPVVGGGMLLVHGDDERDVGRMWGLDPATGIVRWTSEPLENFGDSVPSYSSGRVYVEIHRKVRAFNATTGAVLWTSLVASGSVHLAMAISGGVLYVPGTGTVSALDAATGAPLWTSPILGDRMISDPAVARGQLYIAASSGPIATASEVHRLVALDAATGARRWSVSTTGPDHLNYSSPVVANGLVYAANGDLIAFDAVTGTRRWTYHRADVYYERTPIVIDGRLIETMNRNFAGDVLALVP